MKTKKIVHSVAIIMLIILSLTVLSGCTKTDKKYLEKVGKYSFWDNTPATSVAQYKVYTIIDRFLSEGNISNGKSLDSQSKARKVLFVGFDGVRADAMSNIFFDANSFDTNNYNYESSNYSGLHSLQKSGGLYLGYAGGEYGKDTEQSSSTSAGFTSILTGGWNTLHGVKENIDVKSAQADTIMMKYAKLGLATSFAFDWGQYFDVNLRNEVEYLIANDTLSLVYRDIDRAIAKNNADIMANEGLKKEKEILAKSLELYNEVAMDSVGENALYDIGMRDYLMSRIEANDSFVGGVFHRPDTNGHTTGFSNANGHYVNSVRNANIYLYELIEMIKAREATLDEKWLIIAAADHGGSETGHGKQILEHRTTWIASSQPIEETLLGNNYDGFTEN